MKSGECSQELPQTSCERIVLKIQGIGNVPSFKNSKQWTGKMLITAPKKKKWMERAIRCLESQFAGLFPTKDGGTRGECPRPWRTASYLPLDDSLDWMIPGEQGVERVSKGSEGCIIVIERIYEKEK